MCKFTLEAITLKNIESLIFTKVNLLMCKPAHRYKWGAINEEDK